jgi:hypothetical protein
MNSNSLTGEVWSPALGKMAMSIAASKPGTRSCGARPIRTIWCDNPLP